MPARVAGDRASAAQVLGLAAHAVIRECFQFRFDYPLEIDTQAGPRESPHYYLYGEKLSWSVMRMDAEGIPRAWGRVYGLVYKPAYIAWWGLVNLGHYLRRGDEAHKAVFLRQVDWLEARAVVRADGSAVWPNPFHCLQGRTLLRAPWVSAYDQGMVISAMVRGYRLTGRPSLLELLRRSWRVFQLYVDQGGVRVPVDTNAVVYAELPGGPVPGILDGFMTALLALYDLAVETGDPTVSRLFQDGIRGLKKELPQWDYRSKWSWYGSRAYLSPPSYHHLHRMQLETLARLCAEPIFAEYSRNWDPKRFSAADRAEIYARFVIGKNARRLKHRTWRQNRKRLLEIITNEEPAPANVAPDRPKPMEHVGPVARVSSSLRSA
jgi:hypothetical protein